MRSTSRAQRVASPTSHSTGRSRRRHIGEVQDRTVRVATLDPASQRPFVWMRSRTCPSASFGPHGSRSPRWGMFPYGASPSGSCSRRRHPRTHVNDAARRFEVQPDTEPEQKDCGSRKHPGRPYGRERRARRPKPTHSPRASRYRAPGRRAGRSGRSLPIEEGERDREAEKREQVEIPDGERRRRSARPTRKTRQNPSQTYGRRSVFPPNAPPVRAPSSTRPAVPSTPRSPAGRVLDHGLRDLARLARPRLDEPRSRLRPKAAAVVGSGG